MMRDDTASSKEACWQVLLEHYDDHHNHTADARHADTDDMSEEESSSTTNINIDTIIANCFATLVHDLEQQQQQESTKNTTLHVRNVLIGSGSGSTTASGTTNTTTMDVPPILAHYVQDRVALEALLPATQDVAAEAHVLETAETLTPTCLYAALYTTHLVSLPGALGSGLVDLELLGSVTAVLRRWTLEVCGKEDQVVLVLLPIQGHENASDTPSSSTLPSPSKSPPHKKTRRQQQQQQQLDDEDEEEEDYHHHAKDHPSILSVGLALAQAFLRIPWQAEFASWSFDAKSTILEGMTMALGCLASLNVLEEDKALSTSFVTCLQHASHSLSKQHETAVLLARGLLHLLQAKLILPGGEQGKRRGQEAASQVLQDILEQSPGWNHHKAKASSNSLHTPSRRRRSSLGSPATKTPGTTRRRRSSIEAPGTNATTTALLLSPAALKGRPGGTTPGAAAATATKPRPVWSVFVGLLQKVATTPGLERASVRSPIMACLETCVPALPLPERTHLLQHFVLRLVQSKVSLHRLVACEWLGTILPSSWMSTHHDDIVVLTPMTMTTTSTTPTQDDANAITPTAFDPDAATTTTTTMSLPQALYQALQGRLVDKLAAVRARAATSIEAIIGRQTKDTTSSMGDDHHHLVALLCKRIVHDDTATVRKACLQALTQVLLLQQQQSQGVDEDTLAVLCEACADPSLWTRKAAMDALTALLLVQQQEESSHDATRLVEHAWTTCVLPLLLQEDTATKAIASLQQVVVQPLLVENEDTTASAAAVMRAWRLLAVASPQALPKAWKALPFETTLVELWKLATRKARDLTTTMDDDQNRDTNVVVQRGVWCLLETILMGCSTTSREVPKLVQLAQKQGDLQVLCTHAWKPLLQQQQQQQQGHNNSTTTKSLATTLRSSLTVLSQLAPGLSNHPTVARTILDDLTKTLQGLEFPPSVTGAAVKAMCALSLVVEDDKDNNTRTICHEWITSSYQTCQSTLKNCIQDASKTGIEGETASVVRALFIVGELSMVGFRAEDDAEDIHKIIDATDVLRGVHIPPPRALYELVQTLLPPTLPHTEALTPTAIRAHAFTVLGKLCLRDEGLAKKSLNLLARELHPAAPFPNPSVQSNALLVLGDLCVRYTNMADRYLPVMASCLQAGTSDPEVDILGTSSTSNAKGFGITRKHAVLLLSSLLLQDYIKWRGLLFHRFLVACSDQDEQVATLAESVLSGPLATRQPKLFFNHFVEALFVLNKCTAHPIYIAAASHGDGGSGIAVGFEGIYLDGQLGRLRRCRMYDFLISKLSDEEKIGVTARLAKEVLGEAVNSSSQSGDLAKVCLSNTPPDAQTSPKLSSAWNVLVDTFYILMSPQLKVGKSSSTSGNTTTATNEDETLEDPNILPNPNRQVQVAKSRLLSKISRKHLMEIVLPILCQLKTKLEASHSPLLKDLMMYLLDIFRRYKVEAKEFLANDPTLLQEMEYDARQFMASTSAAAGVAVES